VTYPYLIRVIGKETYGLVLYVQSILLFVTVFINFGFSISATRQISLHINNRTEIQNIANSTLVVKSILFLISLLGIFIASEFLSFVRDNLWLFVFSMAVPFYEAVFPIWYFQGIEKMRYITVLTMLSRVLFTVLIFCFVRTESDYLLIPVFYGIGSVIAASLGVYLMYKDMGGAFFIPKFRSIHYYFMDSLPLFISNFSTQINNRIAKVLIGIFLGVAEVTIYDLAEKIIEALKTPVGLIGQAIYPKVVQLKSSSFVLKIFRVTFIIFFIISIIVALMAPTIINILGGRELHSAINLLRVFLFVLPLAVTRHFLGVQLLIAFGYSRRYSIIITIVAVVYILAIVLLSIYTDMTVFSFVILNVCSEMLLSAILFSSVMELDLLNTGSIIPNKASGNE